jgi:predicted Fe-Mo cluster-binding NifX family protein
MNMNKRIVIPIVNGQLTAHFGHCEKFAVVDVENNNITNISYLTPPMHQPGAYPRFLAENGAHIIIAGGMGHRARSLFETNNIEVCIGVQNGSPRELVENYLNNQLETGENPCDH